MASWFQVHRLLPLLPVPHCFHTNFLLLLILCSPLLSTSRAKPCNCSSYDQDQWSSIIENTTFEQMGAYLFAGSSLSNSSNASSQYKGRLLPYRCYQYYSAVLDSSDHGSLIVPWSIKLWEKSHDGTKLHEASFNVSFSLNKVSSLTHLVLAILPDIAPDISPPIGSPNWSSPLNKQVSINITVSSTLFINGTVYNDFKSTWIEISIEPSQTLTTVSIEYNRYKQLLSVYATDRGKPITTVFMHGPISDHTAPSTFFTFFSSMRQLAQLDTWNSAVEVLPGFTVVDQGGMLSTPTIVGVVLGSSSAMGAAVATAVYLYFNSKYRRWKKDLDQLAKSMQTLPGVPIQVNFSDIQKATNNFHETMKLGRGGFGAVYKCSLPTPVKGEAMEVAVKRFTRDHNRGYNDFLKEVSIINRLRHKNIVPLIGWSYNKGEPLLIYEYMPNGCLEQHLFWSGDKQQNSPICQWDTRYDIVKDVATGLQYVHHEYEPMVLHRDIKASNIMIDSTFQGRLGDFGLACTVANGKNSYSTSLGAILGTLGFIAEEYKHTGRATRKTDVFAFGVLILEIVTGKRALGKYAQFEHITGWVWHLHREGKLLDAVDPVVTTDQFNGDDARRLLLLGLACSSPNPSERPSMMEAVQVITKLSPPPDVPLEEPRFMWPPELEEGSSTSPYFRTANISLERSSPTVVVKMAGRRRAFSETSCNGSQRGGPMAGHLQEQ